MIFCALSLTACGGPESVTYTVEFDTSDPARVTMLSQGVERVMVRKLTALGIEKPSVKSVPSGASTSTVTVMLPKTAEAKEILQKITSEKLTFDMRIEKKSVKDGGAMDPDNWIKTALTGSSLVWVQGMGDKSTGKISLDLEFSEAGAKILSEIFAENSGKSLGIFVRDLLVSKILMEGEMNENHVRIGGVPSEHIANVVMDDINVGLHATFVPHSK